MGNEQVTVTLILLGVVGVLAAIVGGGLEAGSIKFPKVPPRRQTLLAVASFVLIAVGAANQFLPVGSASTRTRTSSATTGPPSDQQVGELLRVVLLPASGNIHVGGRLSVEASVYGQISQLGVGQCVLTWRDDVDGHVVHTDTTMCAATFIEDPVARPGAHRVTATAEGTADVRGRGAASTIINVTS